MGSVRWREIERDGQLLIEEIHKVVVYRFSLGDVDDPEIYAAQPIWEWQQSPAGKFVMENSIEQPSFHRHSNPLTWGYNYAIIAEIEKKKLSEFYLKFGKQNA